MAILTAASAGISSTFAIEAYFTASQGTLTITNPGRAFRILQVLGTGVAASVISVFKNDGTGTAAAIVTCDVTGEALPGILDLAEVEFAATDDVFINVATQNATQATILCVATGAGEALATAV